MSNFLVVYVVVVGWNLFFGFRMLRELLKLLKLLRTLEQFGASNSAHLSGLDMDTFARWLRRTEKNVLDVDLDVLCLTMFSAFRYVYWIWHLPPMDPFRYSWNSCRLLLGSYGLMMVDASQVSSKCGVSWFRCRCNGKFGRQASFNLYFPLSSFGHVVDGFWSLHFAHFASISAEKQKTRVEQEERKGTQSGQRKDYTSIDTLRLMKVGANFWPPLLPYSKVGKFWHVDQAFAVYHFHILFLSMIVR